MAKKYNKPTDKSAAAIGVISIKFDENNEGADGRVRVHYETADLEAFGQPEIFQFDQLTITQQTLIQDLFDSIRAKASGDTKLLERNPQ